MVIVEPAKLRLECPSPVGELILSESHVPLVEEESEDEDEGLDLGPLFMLLLLLPLKLQPAPYRLRVGDRTFEDGL